MKLSLKRFAVDHGCMVRMLGGLPVSEDHRPRAAVCHDSRIESTMTRSAINNGAVPRNQLRVSSLGRPRRNDRSVAISDRGWGRLRSIARNQNRLVEAGDLRHEPFDPIEPVPEHTFGKLIALERPVSRRI